MTRLALLATLFGGWQRFLSGFQDIWRRRITVNVFVTVALVATLAVGEFRPAAIIIFIMAVVGALESYTLDKNRQSIRNLLDLTPQTATIRRGAEEVTVSIGEVQVRTLVIVKGGAGAGGWRWIRIVSGVETTKDVYGNTRCN